jgi:hypothetical protein
MIAARLLLLSLVSTTALLSGCVSQALPPALSRAQAQRLRELPLPVSVGVVRHRYPVYSERLAASLRASNVFERVAPLESFSRPPDLVATIEREVYGSTAIPAAFLLSAGVLPSTANESHGYVFALAPASNRSRKTLVDAHYRGKTTLGLPGLFIAASPHYSVSRPERSRRYRELLAYRTLSALRPETGIR